MNTEKMRVCPNCGHTEDAYTFYCTECGTATIAAVSEEVLSVEKSKNTGEEAAYAKEERDTESEEKIADTEEEKQNSEEEILSIVENDDQFVKQERANKECEENDSQNLVDVKKKKKHWILQTIIAILLFWAFYSKFIVIDKETEFLKNENNTTEVQQEQENDIEEESVNAVVKKSNIDKDEEKETTKTSNKNKKEKQKSSDEYILPDSDSRYLSMKDLKGLSKKECRLARNELFARHGRKFDDEELQKYFTSKSWYHGTIEPEDFNENVFNKYEVANRDFIVKYEEKKGYR